MKLGQRIKKIRLENKMTMQNLADSAELSKGYISMLEKGKNPNNNKEIIPSLDTVQKIASAFNITLEDLLNGVNDKIKLNKTEANETDEKIINTVKQLTEPRKVKVLTYAENELEEQRYIKEDTVVYSYVAMYGSISAGTGHYIYDNPVEQVRVQGIPPKHDLALKVSGDSMLPLFEDGEIVYIKKTPEVLNGQIGAFILDGEAYLKKLYNQNGKIRLVSLNKKYSDIEIKEYSDLNVVGKVIL